MPTTSLGHNQKDNTQVTCPSDVPKATPPPLSSIQAMAPYLTTLKQTEAGTAE
ncbi:hypothetical protein SAY86_006509 [Trapa natans]|uniref:Uncharacterized protein n=1 Tax=Trapa natans TaxID=22666 RepID=A0AAN7QW44_TRANT|nr:hypothetical protein SAY86_006509 [Trapa natans]